MKKIKTILLLCTAGLFFTSCSKEDTPNVPIPIAITPAPQTNVYVASYEPNGSGSKIWKNGVETNLQYTKGALFVSGNDVYTADNETAGNTTIPRVRKNGVIITTFPTGTYIQSLYILANDVYVSTFSGSNSSTIVWKNGSEFQVIPNMYGLKMFLTGNDVYVVGYTPYTATSPNAAALSKNGIVTQLPGASIANDVFVSGNDVYVTGYDVYATGPNAGRPSGAKLWKNGILTNLAGGSLASTVFVSGNDVYVAGCYYKISAISSGNVEQYQTLIWKNGEPTAMDSMITQSYTNFPGYPGYIKIWVVGNDVYVKGSVPISGSHRPRIWKNGVDLTNSYCGLSGYPSDIFLTVN